MKRFSYILTASVLIACCGHVQVDPSPESGKQTEPPFAKGADISWVTEMESRGYAFYNSEGVETECTALIRQAGLNAVRYRVWVDPADGWCNKADVLEKCTRASALDMRIMIDFHYSDWWADPQKQNIPAAWKGFDLAALRNAVAEHTTDVLSTLKAAGIEVSWVQVGNETRTGMLWPLGRLTDADPYSFCGLVNAGYDAVKSVYPSAQVIVHNDNGWDVATNNWFWDLVVKGGAKFDMVGLSLYPSYWDSMIQGYPDWQPKCRQFLSYISLCHANYGKPVMLVEFGMPSGEPEKASAALQSLLDGTAAYDWFKGIFLWEPESEHSRNGYDYGAFADGRPTSALDPFKN